MKLHGLGYVGFRAPDPASFLPFWTEIVGMMPARVLPGETYPDPASAAAREPRAGSGIAPDGSIYLKMDDRQWRIGIHPGEKVEVAYLGFELEDAAALERAMDELSASGTSVTEGTADEVRARGVVGLAWCGDPGGNRVELFHGPVHDLDFASPKGVEFKTGHLGLGHALLMVDDLQASLDFYQKVLGFKRSDFITIGPGMSVHFLRCTRRHHSIALLHVGPFNAVHHLMVEVTSLDTLGAALDRAMDAGLPITSTLGRHLNDKMVSFYMRSPLGFDVEIGLDGLLVDEDTWCDREAAGSELWGHRGMSPEGLEAFGEAHAEART
jgi:3,4-dihydroxy-9,10-secoandrosta-1,3,5(10)-triene-9,17-dione 4,5-dioxygenase